MQESLQFRHRSQPLFRPRDQRILFMVNNFHPTRQLVSLMIVVTALCGSASAASRLRIENVQWGFDGKVVPHAFNPVSFEVHNDGADPFEGYLTLERSNVGSRVDAKVVHPLYLAPNQTQQVQMYPYILNGWSEFNLIWGRGPDQREPLNVSRQLTMGRPATVVLFDPSRLTVRNSGGLPRFDESYFPIAAGSTTGLAAVVMDHQPRWEEPRALAFLDWLYAGGTLHLLAEDGGEQPKFTGPLEELNQPFDEFRVGAGRVVRHQVELSTLDRPYARVNILMLEDEPAEDEPQEPQPIDENYSYNYVNWEISDQMFNRLKQMTRPDHNWLLIYFMALAYLLIIFPGCYLIGRRRADYRVTYGAMIGAVLLFSMGFKTVGQRGYGEETAVHAVTIARPLANGRLLAQQWSNVFVTDGDEYLISHQGDGRLYTSGQVQEAVRGTIVNPPGGEFIVDIPPFSSRTMVSACVIPGDPLEVSVAELEVGERIDQLKLTVGATFPQPDQVFAMHAVYQNQAYALSRDGTTIQLASGSQPFNMFLQPDRWDDDLYGMGFWGEPDQTNEALFDGAMRPLMARSVGMTDQESQQSFSLPPDRVRIFVYAAMPDGMFATSRINDGDEMVSKRVGRVLYSFDVFPAEDATP